MGGYVGLLVIWFVGLLVCLLIQAQRSFRYLVCLFICVLMACLLVGELFDGAFDCSFARCFVC